MQCTFGVVCFVLATEENLFGAKFSALLKGSTSKEWRVLLYQKHYVQTANFWCIYFTLTTTYCFPEEVAR